MKRIAAILLLLAALLITFPASATPASSGSCTTDSSGNVTCIDKKWKCSTAVDIPSVTVTMRNYADDAVSLAAGCTGHIGSITVQQWHGDGIKSGPGAHDITVDTVDVRCYAHDAGKHQDGFQNQGGSNIHFNGGYVGCYSANDSQVTIHAGTQASEVPTDIVYSNIVFDPQAAGAYGISNGYSVDSGFVNDTLVSDSNRHDCFTGVAASNPIWVNVTRPDGTFCP